MEPKEVFSLGLGLSAPWQVAGHRLDVVKRPNELHLEVVADRGALFPCPDCKRACKAHDFGSFTWRHLNFFQHHCLITARVPRIDCPDHGVKRITVPWARVGSRFTLLFERDLFRRCGLGRLYRLDHCGLRGCERGQRPVQTEIIPFGSLGCGQRVNPFQIVGFREFPESAC